MREIELVKQWGIKKLLIEWGYWSSDRLTMAYPPYSTGMPKPIYTGKHRIDGISDEVGMTLEGIVNQLGKLYPELHEVIILTYVKRLPVESLFDDWHALIQHGILKVLNISLTVYKSRLREATIAIHFAIMLRNVKNSLEKADQKA